MKKTATFLLSAAVAVSAAKAPGAALMSLAYGASAPCGDMMQDTWAATDGLGRRLPGSEDAGLPRTNRTVAVFYNIWHESHPDDSRFEDGPFDLTKILARHPDAMEHDASPPLGPWFAPHHWGEPLFGYYLSNDPFVCRKHVQMLADAGVFATPEARRAFAGCVDQRAVAAASRWRGSSPSAKGRISRIS